jgi:hypothetical protein
MNIHIHTSRAARNHRRRSHTVLIAALLDEPTVGVTAAAVPGVAPP